MPPALPLSAAMSVYSSLVFNKIHGPAIAITATRSITCICVSKIRTFFKETYKNLLVVQIQIKYSAK